MRRMPVAPINLSDLEWSRTPKSEQLVIAEDPATESRTFLMKWPGSHRQCDEDTELEYHTIHEEIFCVGGVIEFGSWYKMREMGYLNHPPYWVHPRQQRTDVGVEMLIKCSGPVDFGFVPIPDGWDKSEYVASAAPSISPNAGVSCLQMDELPWQPATKRDGSATGYEAKTIYHNVETGWTPWLMRAQAGWSGTGDVKKAGEGDEMFLLDGDITIVTDDPVRLTGRSYYCNLDGYVDGGAKEGSDEGCLAIRWTLNADFQLPEPPKYRFGWTV